MEYLKNIAADFLFSLDDSNKLETAFDSLTGVISVIGFDSVAYTLIPLSLSADLPPVFLNSKDFSTEFLAHYEEAELAQNDFTIRRVASGCQETLHWRRELETGLLAPEECDVVLVAAHDYGITNAVTLPVQQSRDVIAGFSVTSSAERKQFDELLETHHSMLSLLCCHFHRYVCQQHRWRFYRHVIDDLSIHERYVIDLVANGNRLKQAKDLYGLSQSLAGKTLHKLYKKFSVSDQGELGYLVGRHQLIEFLDIDK